MPKRDYYEILGVPRTATTDEIRRAHRKLARQHHPDMNKGSPKSTEKFKEVQEAYDVLSDPERRKTYDEFGHAGAPQGFGGPPPGGAEPFEAFRRAGGGRGGKGQWRAGAGPRPTAQPADMPGDLGSIFDELFGAGRGRGGAAGGFGAGFTEEDEAARAAAAGRGQDVEHAVQLTFEQAAQGATLPLRIQSPGGTETIEFKIPPGVSEGSKVRLRGKGHAGPRAPGDLIIVCKVAPHPVLRREGVDIYSDAPVTVYDALLGGKVTVPTLTGDVTLTIPPGTSSGAKLRIKGHGIAKAGGEVGDQYAVIKILIPKDLSPEAKDLVERLRAAAPIKP